MLCFCWLSSYWEKKMHILSFYAELKWLKEKCQIKSKFSCWASQYELCWFPIPQMSGISDTTKTNSWQRWMNEGVLMVIPVTWSAAPLRGWRFDSLGRRDGLNEGWLYLLMVKWAAEILHPHPHVSPPWSQVWRSWITKASWPTACPQLNTLLASAADLHEGTSLSTVHSERYNN